MARYQRTIPLYAWRNRSRLSSPFECRTIPGLLSPTSLLVVVDGECAVFQGRHLPQMWRVRARATTHDGRPGPQSGRISRCRIHGPSGYDQGIPNIFIAHPSSLRCVCPCTTRQKSTFCKSIPSRNMAGWCCWCAKPPQFYILLIFNLQGLLEGGQSNGFVLRAHLQKVYAIAECTTHIMYCSTLFCSRKKNAYSFQPTKDCIDTSG